MVKRNSFGSKYVKFPTNNINRNSKQEVLGGTIAYVPFIKKRTALTTPQTIFRCH
jgi:hypothetical protein